MIKEERGDKKKKRISVIKGQKESKGSYNIKPREDFSVNTCFLNYDRREKKIFRKNDKFLKKTILYEQFRKSG